MLNPQSSPQEPKTRWMKCREGYRATKAALTKWLKVAYRLLFETSEKRERSAFYFVVILLLWASVRSAEWVGYLLGWLTGASQSSVTAIVAPMVFGLLAVLGVGVGISKDLSTKSTVLKAVFVAVAVWSFCFGCHNGLQNGIRSRLGTYVDIGATVGDEWQYTDDDVVTELYAFQTAAKRRGMGSSEFYGFVRDVIGPILNDDQPDKLERVRKAIATVESALPEAGKSQSALQREPAR